MKVLGLAKLEEFKKEHSTIRKTINAWILEVENACWENPQDIKERYRTADFLSENRVIFNIKGNSFRLVAKIDYQRQIVLVEWIGTHAEYSKKSFR